MVLFTPDIYKLKKQNRIAELTRLLDHKDKEVRFGAFNALSSRADLSDEIINKLKIMMHSDPDHWIRTMVTLRFARFGDPSVSKNLLEIIEEGNLKSKLELLRFITDNGPTSDVTILQIIMIALSDSNILVRLQAITAANAVKNKELIPYIGEMLKEQQYKARLLAAKALYNIDRDGTVDYLITLLDDKNLQVLSAIRTYLAAINADRSYKIISNIPIIDPDGENEPVYVTTIQGISEESMMKALAVLNRACNDRYRGIRVEALKSLAIFRHPSSVDLAEKLLYDRFPEVRIEALYTLEKLGGRRALKAIERKGRDKKKAVRDAMGKVLNRMRKIH
jgi:HEAT repeat protein